MRKIMRKALFAIVALTAFAGVTPSGFTGVAEARDGCGRGFVFDGRRCVPVRGPSWRPAGPDRWGQMTYWPGPRRSCPPRYTVQDGLCKPYRGF
jgi:hypothetical protein